MDKTLIFNGPDVIPFEARERSRERRQIEHWVSDDSSSQKTLRYIERIAGSEIPVLICGESGTGKEVLARHVHELSRRRGRLVAVNCAAVCEQLADSELFGHEAGSFTGATARRSGWFEAAEGGTLFLDEIGELPLALQRKLLRVLQEREVVRIGARQPIPLDVRVIAATNIDLEAALDARRFRADLFYRLNVCQIQLAPLRKRRADILPLARFFLQKYSRQLDKAAPVLTDEACRALEQHEWPGNIRELENLIHGTLILANGDTIGAADFEFCPLRLDPQPGTAESESVAQPGGTAPMLPLERLRQTVRELFDSGHPVPTFAQLKDLLLEEARASCGYDQLRTMNLLRISRSVLRNHAKCREHPGQPGSPGR